MKKKKKKKKKKEEVDARPMLPGDWQSTKRYILGGARRNKLNHTFWRDIEDRILGKNHSAFVLNKQYLEQHKAHLAEERRRKEAFRTRNQAKGSSNRRPYSAGSPLRKNARDHVRPSTAKGRLTGTNKVIFRKRRGKRKKMKKRAKKDKDDDSEEEFEPYPPGYIPGPAKYHNESLLSSDSPMLRGPRPPRAVFSRDDRFNPLGSGDINAKRGIGVPGPNVYEVKPQVAITAKGGKLTKSISTPVLTRNRLTGTQLTWVPLHKGFYFCSRNAMLRHGFPGPTAYKLSDSYLSNNKGTGGQRFSDANPKGFVDWVIYRSKQIPGPSEYKVDTAEKSILPKRDTVVPFETNTSRNSDDWLKNANKRYDPDFETLAIKKQYI